MTNNNLYELPKTATMAYFDVESGKNLTQEEWQKHPTNSDKITLINKSGSNFTSEKEEYGPTSNAVYFGDLRCGLISSQRFYLRIKLINEHLLSSGAKFSFSINSASGATKFISWIDDHLHWANDTIIRNDRFECYLKHEGCTDFDYDSGSDRMPFSMFIVIRDKVVDLLEDYHGGTDIAGRIEVEQSPGFMGWCSYWGGASTSCNYYKQN